VVVNVRIASLLRALALVLAAFAAEPCLAAGGEFVDKAAHVLALFIIIVLPIGGVILFWLVHILPEKAAEKRHHPQKDAIQVLCLLSLVFGGLLWPLAWLWAYSKPVMYKLAYGRDKHDDYYAERQGEGESEPAAQSLHEELSHLRQELEELQRRGELPESLQSLRDRVARLESRSAPGTTTEEGAR
jgi:CBS domain containing-hemolysin-like protein